MMLNYVLPVVATLNQQIIRFWVVMSLALFGILCVIGLGSFCYFKPFPLVWLSHAWVIWNERNNIFIYLIVKQC